MTPAQRKFKKQMKELERDGKIPEKYAPRRERGSYRKPISIVAVLFLLWNSFALYTWIAPNFNKYTNPGISQVSESRYEETSALNFAKRSKHKKIKEYLATTGSIIDDFNLIAKRVSDHTWGYESYSFEEVHEDLVKLKNHREWLESVDFAEYRINDLYLSGVNSLEQVLFNLDSSSIVVSQNYDNYSNIIGQTQEALIEFLESNEIEYVVNGNGTITYYTIN